MKNLNGWMVVHGFMKTHKFTEQADLFLHAAEQLGVGLQVVDHDQVLAKGTGLSKKPDFVLFYDKDVWLAKYLENQGILVLNSSEAIGICDDKRDMVLALQEHRVPMPDFVIGPMCMEGEAYPNFDFLAQVEKSLGYPCVGKSACGSFGAQVALLSTRNECVNWLKNAQGNSPVFQEYIDKEVGVDYRVQVVRDHAVAAMKRCSHRDFRANASLGGSCEKVTITAEMEEIAVKAAVSCGCVYAGVDLLLGEHGYLVCEVNSNAHIKNLRDATGIDASFPILEDLINACRDY